MSVPQAAGQAGPPRAQVTAVLVVLATWAWTPSVCPASSSVAPPSVVRVTAMSPPSPPPPPPPLQPSPPAASAATRIQRLMAPPPRERPATTAPAGGSLGASPHPVQPPRHGATPALTKAGQPGEDGAARRRSPGGGLSSRTAAAGS